MIYYILWHLLHSKQIIQFTKKWKGGEDAGEMERNTVRVSSISATITFPNSKNVIICKKHFFEVMEVGRCSCSWRREGSGGVSPTLRFALQSIHPSVDNALPVLYETSVTKQTLIFVLRTKTWSLDFKKLYLKSTQKQGTRRWSRSVSSNPASRRPSPLLFRTLQSQNGWLSSIILYNIIVLCIYNLYL